ncbi:putative disease resistance RPP13-like protein 1 [Cajanus cajan]|uniref:Disease resistance RPP13-like protein 1 n=1 Tax=Cajanus cajan TaxID=3821 RepID=A0A151TKX9_CAJCA|nr:putative disease resistance RPP13-like protein 1 [Cajanus cajan]KYP67679.1 Putative disease resistance RPP13-like protein 1 [Cajanus cajan]
MHDLIYDLAKLVSGKSSCYFECGKFPGSVRHLTFLAREFDVSRRFEGLYELKCLRTFLQRRQYSFESCYLAKVVSCDWLPKLRCLRTLSLSEYKNITELPNSIGNLVLLRYLDLSYTYIKMLPNATFVLYNLQTLKLSNCKFLIQLPEQLGNLVNLRHLDISDTYLELPTQICNLQSLRTLTYFVVGKQNGLSITKLRRFPHLQGKLSILELQNVDHPMEAFQANLKKKEQIEELTLEWGSDPQDSQIAKDVLDNLQPSTNLKELNIRSYGGTSFPKWLGDSSYSNVIVLGITDCNYCLSLPPFGQLPSLKELAIKRMKMVNTIGNEFYCSNLGLSSFQPFPLLESLQFEDMPEWEEWLPFEVEGSNFCFPCLKSLTLSKCPNLRGNLPSSLPSLTKISISECKLLETKACDLQWNSSVEVIHIREGGEDLFSLLDKYSWLELSIENCDSFQSLPRMMLGANCLQRLTLKNIPSLISFPTHGLSTSLQLLEIKYCGNLEFLSHETWHKYTSLEKLIIRNSCHSMKSFPLDCFPSLQWIHILYCPNLEAITTQGGWVALKLLIFCIRGCEKLSSLPEQIVLPVLKYSYLRGLPQLLSIPPSCLPSSLESLWIGIGILSSMSKHELGSLFQCLTSLSSLRLWGFSGEDLLNTLLKERLLPTSLQHLMLWSFDGLKLLEGKGLQHLTSLRELHIWYCGSLESLPEDQLSPSLELLEIDSCPLLEARYQSQKGKYWSKIAHIPAIKINGEVII